jgi:hypothetical protein
MIGPTLPGVRTSADRLGDGARPRRSRLGRAIGAAAAAFVLGVPLALAGSGSAGAQELCLDGTVLVICSPTSTSAPTTEAPATTTTRPATTTTQPPVSTTEAPSTTDAPSTAGPTTTTRPTTASTTRSSTTRLPTSPTPATVLQETTAPVVTDPATTETAATIASPTTAAPTVVDSATTTTAAPTTFDVVVDKPPTERVTPIGLSEEVSSTPVEPASHHTAQLAVIIGATVAIGLVVLVGYRERHRPEAD